MTTDNCSLIHLATSGPMETFTHSVPIPPSPRQSVLCLHSDLTLAATISPFHKGTCQPASYTLDFQTRIRYQSTVSPNSLELILILSNCLFKTLSFDLRQRVNTTFFTLEFSPKILFNIQTHFSQLFLTF